MLDKVKQFNRLLNAQNGNLHTAEDIYALELISGILHNGPYLPMNKMALRPYALAFLMNELVINSRKKMIEFGAGISTILLGRLIKSLSLKTTIVSVDENKEWTEFISATIQSQQLSDFVKVLHVPLESRNEMAGTPHWYNQQELTSKIGDATFDMVLIDGPTAFNKQIEQSRYFALPFLQKRLESSHVIFLDDSNREGEQQVIKAWKENLGFNFDIYAGTLGISYKGDHFEANPLRFSTVTPA